MSTISSRTSSNDLDRSIHACAAAQHRVIRYSQLRNLGVSDGGIAARLRAGRLLRLHRGVYLVGPPPVSSESRWIAAVFAAGDRAVLTGIAAAELWGWCTTSSHRVTLVTDGPRRRISGASLRVTRSLPDVERSERRGIRITNASRTVVEYSLASDPYDTVGLLHEVAYRQQLDLGEIRDIRHRLRNQRNSWRISFAIEQHLAGSQGVRSRDERYLLGLYMDAGIELPFANVLVETPRGPYLVDQVWSRRRAVVELDGPGHARASARARDVDRDGALRDAGYRLLRIPRDAMYGDPELVLQRVRGLLQGHAVTL